MLYAEIIGLVQLWPWPGGDTALALAWPWVELTGLGLEGWGLGLGTCGLVNIPENQYIRRCVHIHTCCHDNGPSWGSRAQRTCMF